ncbi:pickpocket protein 28-like [Lucilia sericata]|uniref:pickpocket protein 28-like n=1 Tax=Lucilia sericata TaxID=13632 RepID=UPI0018A7EF3C|nr:pickpocket protein 28-like [Lucilia sericata]
MKSEHRKKSNLPGNDDITSLSSLDLSNVSSGVINKANFFYGSRKSAYKAVLREYSKKTSVHGLNYVLQIHRPFYEKLYWIVALLLSLYLATYYMWGSYVKWSNIPIILGFDETLVKINQIPFPTITICPENQINFINYQFSNISDLIWFEIEEYGNFQNRNNISEEEKLNFLLTLQICDQETIDRYSPYMPKNLNINVAQNLIDIVSDAQTILTFVEFKGDSNDYDLEMVLTNEGVCYQFNGLNHQDIYNNIDYIPYNGGLKNNISVTGSWSLDDGYQNSSEYPIRTSSSSISSGFYLYSLRLKSFKQVFKVFINSPDNIPQTTDNYYIMVPDSKQVIVTVLPQFIKTQANLRDFDIEKRQCYFNKERNLRFFKFYTQNNCQTECLTNYTIAKCGCAKFWMPKPSDIPFCDFTQLTCCSKAAQELDVILTNQTIKKLKIPK